MAPELVSGCLQWSSIKPGISTPASTPVCLLIEWVFYMYLLEIWFVDLLHPRLKRRPGKKVFFGDNLAGHISLKVIDLCKANDIPFMCLPPNSTDKLLPLDRGVFGPLKVAWRKILTNFKAGNLVHNVR